jgi:hypothetical protein
MRYNSDMSDEKPITSQQAEARLGVALDALGQAPGDSPLADNALRGARQVLLAFKMALLSQEPQSPDASPGKPLD